MGSKRVKIVSMGHWRPAEARIDAIEAGFDVVVWVVGWCFDASVGGVQRISWVLTEASLPVAETAATERLDCRRAFLNIVIYGVQRELRLVSLKERCNWGRRWLKGEDTDGWGRALSSGRRFRRPR
jgi:hypothetical protein